MIKPIPDAMITTTSVDKPPSSPYYRYTVCKHKLPFVNKKDIDFLYCPYCARKFTNLQT